MGVSYKVAHWLNSDGHNAIHLSEQGLHTMDDSNIVRKATIENRIILTADMDFGQILALTKLSSVSVIQLRIFDLTPGNIISKLKIVLERLSEQLDTSPLIITIQENKIRFKTLPL